MYYSIDDLFKHCKRRDTIPVNLDNILPSDWRLKIEFSKNDFNICESSKIFVLNPIKNSGTYLV